MLNLYIPVADNWMFIDNSKGDYSIVAEGGMDTEYFSRTAIWEQLQKDYYGKQF